MSRTPVRIGRPPNPSEAPPSLPPRIPPARGARSRAALWILGLAILAGVVWLLLARTGGGPALSPAETMASTQPVGFGSGFFITDDGYLLTNHHVVEKARAVRVQIGEEILEAVVVETDPDTDLAILKVEGSFTPAAFASGNHARLGQTVFTVGFPIPELQGVSPKVTKGVISSLRGLQDDSQSYQIDAAVQPGNSGGPLADEFGAVVGVVVARLGDQVVMEATGAIPQNVNYAIKKAYVLAFLQGHPDVMARIQTAVDDPSVSFEQAVERIQAASAMILIY